MKRWLVWSLVSVATFLVGIAFVCVYSIIIRPNLTAEREIEVSPTVIVQPKPSVNFEPEFRGLPKFEDQVLKRPDAELIHFLDDSIFRRSDVVAKNGDRWFVVTKTNSFLLSEHRAKVKHLNSVSLPGEEKDALLTFSSLSTTPLFAIRGVRTLKPGPINTLYFGRNWATDNFDDEDDSEISTGFRREFTFGEKTYLLRTSTGVTKDGTKLAVLLLESNGVKQILWQAYHVPSDDRDILGSLLWAGDIDRDGGLDLYFQEFNEKGFTGTYLFLSSFADKEELVKIAADFGMPGC